MSKSTRTRTSQFCGCKDVTRIHLCLFVFCCCFFILGNCCFVNTDSTFCHTYNFEEFNLNPELVVPIKLLECLEYMSKRPHYQTKTPPPPPKRPHCFFQNENYFTKRPHFFIAKNGTFNIFVLLNVVVCLYRFVPPLEWCRHASIFHMYVNW